MTAILPSSFLVILFPCPCRVLTNFRAVSFVYWETLSEHGSATFRLLFCGLILNHIPMLHEYPFLDAHDVRSDPIHRGTETAKSPVHDHKVSLRHDRSRFVFQRWRKALHQVK